MESLKPIYLNEELSMDVFKQSKRHVEIKKCYNNVFHVVTKNKVIRKGVMEGNIKIAYGYVQVLEDDNIYCRHCFLVKDGEVIDPTIMINDKKWVREYFIFKTLGRSEYISAIEKDDGQPGLYEFLHKENKKIIIKSMEEGLFFID